MAALQPRSSGIVPTVPDIAVHPGDTGDIVQPVQVIKEHHEQQVSTRSRVEVVGDLADNGDLVGGLDLDLGGGIR